MPAGYYHRLKERDRMRAEYQRQQGDYSKELPTLKAEEAALLNKGDYAGAWKFAETHGDPNKTGLGSGDLTQNSLVADLETARGLQSLGVKPMDAKQMQGFYDAAAQNWDYKTLGHNPYGKTEWGDKGYVHGDAAVNARTAGDNQYADLARFAGKQPDQSFVSKYGAVILEVVAAIVAPELLPAFAAMGIGATAADAIIFGAAGAGGAELSGGNVLEGAALGALGGALGPGGAAGGISRGVSSAVGGGVAGDIAGGVVTGAGTGAAKAALTGGDIGKGAEYGAVGGAYTGSGLAGDVSSAFGGGAIGGAVSGAVGGAVTGAAVGRTSTAGAVATGAAKSAGGSLASQWASKALGGG